MTDFKTLYKTEYNILHAHMFTLEEKGEIPKNWKHDKTVMRTLRKAAKEGAKNQILQNQLAGRVSELMRGDIQPTYEQLCNIMGAEYGSRKMVVLNTLYNQFKKG